MNNLIVIFLMVISIIAIIGGLFSLGNMIFVSAIWGYFLGLSGAFWVAVTIILLTVGYLLFSKYFKDYIEDKSNNGSLHEFISNLYIQKGSSDYKRLRYFSSLGWCCVYG